MMKGKREVGRGKMGVWILLAAVWVAGIQPATAQNLESETTTPPPGTTSALQEGDYPAYPRIDADYHHLELELEWLQGEQLEGSARYTLRLMRPGIAELRLQANRMDISTVRWNGSPAEWQVRNEELLIQLPEGASADQDHRLRIDYVADPLFGMHRTPRGTYWSSGLPGAHSHWLPVWDHPRNRFSMEVALRIPETHQALFTGTRAGESVQEGIKEVRFYTEGERAVPTLRFAIGEFDTFDLTAGRYRVELYAEPGVLESDQASEWLTQARMQLESMTQHLQNHLPHRTLTFLYLEDDMWELNPWGSGLNLLFERRGEILSQIQRGIAAQWFGVGRIAEQWSDADAVHLLREWLVRNLDPAPQPLPADTPQADLGETPYAAYDPERLDDWQVWLESEEGSALQEQLSSDIDAWFLSLPTLLRWQDFGEWIYEESGRAMMNPPVRPDGAAPADSVSESIAPDTLTVTVPDGDLSETIPLSVRRVGPRTDEAVSGTVRVIHLQGEETQEVTFRQTEQEILVPGASGIENVVVTLEEGAPVELHMEKPASFWLYQLREGDADARKRAALGLAAHRENPDLQLALNDLLGSEEETEVQAAMLRTLGDVVSGATGTDQTFRDRFTLDQPESIQLALVHAMGYYEGNSEVITLLRRIVVSDVPVSVKRAAIHSLDRARGETPFAELSRALLANEASEPVLADLLERVAMEDPLQAVEWAAPYLQSENEYELRMAALDLLLAHDTSVEGWQERLEQWGSDRDPRIRYRLLAAADRLSAADRESWLQERLVEEDDARVRHRIRTLLESDTPALDPAVGE